MHNHPKPKTDRSTSPMRIEVLDNQIRPTHNLIKKTKEWVIIDAITRSQPRSIPINLEMLLIRETHNKTPYG